MNRKRLFRRAVAAALLAAIPYSVTAVSPSPSPSSSPAAQSQRLTNLKTRGAAEIDRRIASLEAALAKLTASTHLPDADQATLTQQVNDELASLKALKADLADDTDLTDARTHVQSVVTDYRVYALMLPKARMVASADRFVVAQDKLAQLAAKLQTKVDAAKTAGHDTTAMQAKLDDMTAQIAASKTAAAGMVTKLLVLKPTDYNANHTVLVDYRASLKTAHDDLKTARDDAKSVIDALHALK